MVFHSSRNAILADVQSQMKLMNEMLSFEDCLKSRFEINTARSLAYGNVQFIVANLASMYFNAINIIMCQPSAQFTPLGPFPFGWQTWKIPYAEFG